MKDEIYYEESHIVALATLENGKKKLVTAPDVYAAMDKARKYCGLVMKIEVLGFAGDLFTLYET